MRKVFLLLVVALFVIPFASSAMSATIVVDIDDDPVWGMDPCPIEYVVGDILRFTNNADVDIVVKVWNQDNTVETYSIAVGNTDDHATEAGDVEVKVFDTEDNQVFECKAGTAAGIPTMTQWGVIILIALIIGSGVLLMVRRKKAMVTA
jgi:hypothetical protein